MKMMFQVLVSYMLTAGLTSAAEPLPSWNDGAARSTLLTFVERVTTKDSPDYVAPAERIAVFDNDGTLWCEQPLYFQFYFVLDRMKQLAPQHPEWKTTQPFKAALENDRDALAAIGEKGFVALGVAAHAGATSAEFEQHVRDWLTTAKHPRFKRPFTELVYQPMVELLQYLRAHDFKTYIVSGGGLSFIRVWADKAYGIPPEQVIGSSVKTRFEYRDGKPAFVRLPLVDFVDDGPGKPVGIHRNIGRQPLLAFGNSDGDLEMLQYTTAGKGRRLGLIVHHTDAEREYAYDRKSPVGRLDKALDQAKEHHWIVVDMKKDWKRVFPFEK